MRLAIIGWQVLIRPYAPYSRQLHHDQIAARGIGAIEFKIALAQQLKPFGFPSLLVIGQDRYGVLLSRRQRPGPLHPAPGMQVMHAPPAKPPRVRIAGERTQQIDRLASQADLARRRQQQNRPRPHADDFDGTVDVGLAVVRPALRNELVVHKGHGLIRLNPLQGGIEFSPRQFPTARQVRLVGRIGRRQVGPFGREWHAGAGGKHRTVPSPGRNPGHMRERVRQLRQPLRQRRVHVYRRVAGQRYKPRMGRTGMKSKVASVRCADPVDIQAKDGAFGEWFLRGERGFALTTEQRCYSIGPRRPGCWSRVDPWSV